MTKILISDDKGQRIENTNYEPPKYDGREALARSARNQRDYLMRKYVDKVNYFFYTELTDEEKTCVSIFRNGLKNIPEQENFPHKISWPEIPDCLR